MVFNFQSYHSLQTLLFHYSYHYKLRVCLVRYNSYSYSITMSSIPNNKDQGFETRTGSYGPTGKISNGSFCGFFSFKNRSMCKKQGPMRTAVRPHDSENRDQTASHGSLLPFESELKKKKKTLSTSLQM